MEPTTTTRLDIAGLREHIIGCDAPVQTPFGERPLVYADYTASGRCLDIVEDYIRSLAVVYANSHTEDSYTGRTVTHLLEQAEESIKRSLNAGPHGKVVAVGSGATGAVHKLQEILGIAVPPATCRMLENAAVEALGEEALGRLQREVQRRSPIVFVGPFEHHSNEISWREGYCDVVEVDLDANGGLDLAHLERLARERAPEGRRLIGSFSAASNVTGVRTPVHEIARLMHRYGGIAVFDFAAAGPYVEIDMNPAGDPEGRLDAVFLSPHKFLGGPGAAGLLVFDGRLYPPGLAPTVAGGGTVIFVDFEDQTYVDDIEEREKAGTPGLFQTLRAALALEVKEAIGVEAIHGREHELFCRALDRWTALPTLQIYGPHDPDARLGIVSMNVMEGERVLHSRFVTRLLSDLFGIQSRAGCSCAGPYGHRLLEIGPEMSGRMRDWSERGYHGIRPGWFRVGLHYAMDDLEADYLIEAVAFVAEYGRRFVPQYRFDVTTGVWTHERAVSESPEFSLATAMAGAPAGRSLGFDERRRVYTDALDEARRLAATLDDPDLGGELAYGMEEVRTFALPADGVDYGHGDGQHGGF